MRRNNTVYFRRLAFQQEVYGWREKKKQQRGVHPQSETCESGSGREFEPYRGKEGRNGALLLAMKRGGPSLVANRILKGMRASRGKGKRGGRRFQRGCRAQETPLRAKGEDFPGRYPLTREDRPRPHKRSTGKKKGNHPGGPEAPRTGGRVFDSNSRVLVPEGRGKKKTIRGGDFGSCWGRGGSP